MNLQPNILFSVLYKIYNVAIFLYCYHLFEVVYWTQRDAPFNHGSSFFFKSLSPNVRTYYFLKSCRISNLYFFIFIFHEIVNAFIFNSIRKYGILSGILHLSPLTLTCLHLSSLFRLCSNL